MAKFNLKEHIAKNKATFFGSLTEGQFSWMTQDTGQQIGSQDENKIPVYMFDDKGKYYYENDYDGYGVFGGKDYYELLDQMNGGAGDREKGIDLAFNKAAVEAGKVLFPALVTDPYKFNYKTHDFTQEAPTDPNQSWYEPEEDEETDYGYGFGDMDREEDYDEEELEEGYMGQFYAPEYLEKKYGKEMAKKIEAEIDEMDENSWDRFTGMESAKEVDEYVADIVSMLKEGEAAYEYEKGKEAGEKIEKTKMKKSELKAKIKEMILAEYEKDVNITDENPESEVDFLAELEGMLNEAEGLTPLQDYVYQYEIEISGEDRAQDFLDDIRRLNTPQDVYDYYAYERELQDYDVNNIFGQVKRKFKNLGDDLTPLQRQAYNYTKERFGAEEAKNSLDQIKTFKNGLEFADWVYKKLETLNEADDTEKDTAETDTAEVAVDDTETIDTETTSEVDPNVKAVQDALTQAQAAAQQLGDKKLMDQIGNTITFFTRAHVVEKPKGAVAEEMNLNITEDITANIEKKIKSGEIDPKEVEAAAKKAMSGDSTDLALMMAGFGKMFEDDKKSVNENTGKTLEIETPEDLKKVEGSQIFKYDVLDREDFYQYKVYILADDKSQAEKIAKEKFPKQFPPYKLDTGYPQKSSAAENLWTGKEKNSFWYGVEKTGAVTENLKETLLLQKRAGIITEAQYKQKLNEASEDEVPLTPKVKSFINKAIADSKKDGEFENLKEADWFENELIDELIDLFPNKDYDSASSEVMDYISQAIK